jgi:hypothetical protein
MQLAISHRRSQPTDMLPPQEPDPSDKLAEDWTSWLAHLDLDSRQVGTFPSFHSLVCFCRLFLFHLFTVLRYINRACTQYLYIYYRGTRCREPLWISPWLPLDRGPPLGGPAEIRTRACLASSRRTDTVLVHPFLSQIRFPFLNHNYPNFQCLGSVTFWCGSGSPDPYQ